MKNYCAVLLAGFCFAAQSAASDSLTDHDNGPFTGIFGLPDSREGGSLERAGLASWSLDFTASSHSTLDSHGVESILLDGETRRMELVYRRGISERIELGINIPWVSHESGSMDAFIDQWHNIFGLPDGIRHERPRDTLLFLYHDDNQQLTLDQNTNGLGDIRLLGAFRLSRTANRSAALRASAKFPTGDSATLLGSGAVDLSLTLAVDLQRVMRNDRLDGFYRVSAIWIGEPESFPARSRRFAGQVSAGLSYSLTSRIGLAAQALLRSPLYKSDIAPLGDVAASLTMGARFRLPGNYLLTLSVGEDIHPDSMPDVTFGVSLQSPSR